MSLCLLRRVRVLEIACLILTLFLPHAAVYAAPLSLSQLSGWTYLDRNNDGHLAFSDEPTPDYVIEGVTINLFQLIGVEEVEIASAVTNNQGRYAFSGLSAGTYSIRQIQPVAYVDGLDTLGALRSASSQQLPGSAFAGTMSNDKFAGIVLPAGAVGEMYNFGELGFAPGYVSKRFLLASAPPLPTIDRLDIPEPASCGLLAGAAGLTLLDHRRARRRRASVT